MIIADTPKQIELYRLLVLRKALELEMKDIYMFKGKSTAWVTIKKEFNIRGSRERVLDFISDVIKAAQQPERERGLEI
tara:strand:- start:163 stop:396 length:234 start_codon:yes stop_codon:yes gene_type:complete